MACVFGNPIDDEDTERIDRAQKALNMKNSNGKDVKARNYVETLKREWDDYLEEIHSDFKAYVCYLILVYNATGETLRYSRSNDYEGHLAHAPYPSSIANGQWGAFLHVQDVKKKNGSYGRVVYGDRAEDGMGWSIVWNNPGTEKLADINIYGEVKSIETYNKDDIWTTAKDNYENGKSLVYHGEESNGAVIDGSTGRGLAPLYEVILSFGA